MPREVGARKQQILQALAQELESNPGSRITTAQLAKSVGVSEAALYRHFPSKARMFESLIAFAEETVFGLAQRALRDEPCASRRCAHLLRILVGFAARNPGITRVLCGEPLVGEHERLRARVGQFFDRCETQLKQVLREYEGVPGQRLAVVTAALGLGAEHQAGTDETTVQRHRTGAAIAGAAAFLGAGEAEPAAQCVEQRLVRRAEKLARIAVDRGGDGDGLHFEPPARA